ncbi:MAG: DoxX family protein [Chakrabartia sp.]
MVQQGKVRTSARYLLALIYLLAGVAHLRSPAGFLQITPGWVPFPEHIIFITGVCEIAGAAALAFVPKLRRAAGIALALYAVCVYPANIKHALEGIAVGGTQMSWWYHAPRLAFQPIFIWWALWAGSVTDWPFARKSLT